MEKSNETSKDYIINQLKKQIENFETGVRSEKVGKVIEIGDGVARVSGLGDVMASEMVEFPGGVIGVALNLEEDAVGVIILGD
ncbi:MAG: ATP synthase subunit alpha, partial [Candidatus Moranbacteria bacterium GW2011_GWD2_37_9]